MAIWMQPMRTRHLTQAQDLGRYARLIQSQISLAIKPCRPGKSGTLARIAGAVLLHKALLCFEIYLFLLIVLKLKLQAYENSGTLASCFCILISRG